MKDITEPLSDPITGKPSFVRAMAEEFFNRKPFESLEQWEWEWLRQDLSVAQIEEGLTEAFEYGPNPSHSLVYQVLAAARQRVERGLPPYGKLWEGPSGTDKRRYIDAVKQRVALATIRSGGRVLGKRNFRPADRPSSESG